MSFHNPDFGGPDFDAKAASEAERQRHAKRDSLFLGAAVVVKGENKPFDVRVRNLSAGGLLAESKKLPPVDSEVMIDLRNVGEVRGRVMWASNGRFGVAFLSVIDPQAVRKPVGQGKAERDPVLRPYYPATGRNSIKR